MMNLKERAAKLKTDLPAVFLALQKKETPLAAKAAAAAALVYALSPIDLIPDFIPILGYLDDLILLPLLVALTIRLIPAELFAQCRQEAQGLWPNGKPSHWYYAVPVVAIWLLLLFLLIRAIWY